MQYHLAIFTQPWLDLILDGKKTIDSRLAKVQCAPYGKISEGDVVYMKESAGLVKGEFIASKIEFYNDLTPEILHNIRSRNHKELFVNMGFEEFREKWTVAKYATLIHITNVNTYKNPFPFPKKDRRSWILLNKSLIAS